LVYAVERADRDAVAGLANCLEVTCSTHWLSDYALPFLEIGHITLELVG
jgi:hypothetical protein